MPGRFARIPLALMLALAALAATLAPAAGASTGPLALDPLFGTGGVVSGGTIVPGFHSAGGIAVTARRDILLAGEGEGGAALARFYPNGDLDSSYAGGVGVLGLPRLSGVNGLAASADEGAFVLSGRTTVTRITPGGFRGEGFGDRGSVYVPALDPRLASLRFWSLAAQPDGGVLVAGIRFGSPRMVVVRLLADGSLDPSFGEAGLVTLRMGPRGCGALRLAELPGGKILLAGYAQNRPALVRLLPDGAPDPSFGRNGRVFGPRRMHGSITALALRPNGGVVVAGQGSTASGKTSGVFLLLFGRSGAFDRRFGPPRLVAPLRRYANPTAVVQAGTRFLVAATGPEPALKAFSRHGRPLRSLDGVPGVPSHQTGGVHAVAQAGKLLFSWTPRHQPGHGEIRLERFRVG